MRYGLGYQGSKNKIAEWVVEQLPAADTLVDLFAGGCSITHCAMAQNKYKNYIINDIQSDVVTLFCNAVNGKYENETRWIDRETFFKEKDEDPFIKYCWSFSNNGVHYLYAKEIEPWKKAVHYARVFKDFSELEKMGIKSDGNRADIVAHKDEYKTKYIKWYIKNVLKSDLDFEQEKYRLSENIKTESENLRNYLLNGLKVSGHTQSEVDKYLGTQMSSHYFGRSQWAFPTREEYKKLQNFLYLPEDYDRIVGLQSVWQRLQSLQNLESLQSLQILQSLQSLGRLQSLERLESLGRLQKYSVDYSAVPIPDNAVIYCDIPYKGTDCGCYTGFDHERFYEWAKEKNNIFISEYSMPEPFIEIASIQKVKMNTSNGARPLATERIYTTQATIDKFDLFNQDEQIKWEV